MQLYDCRPAPNPRRVRIFIAEKGLHIPTTQIDLMAREQFSEEFRRINSGCTVPVLVTDAGESLTEGVAICTYLEALYPQPVLMGVSIEERARVLMWNQIVELQGFAGIAEALRNGNPAFADRSLPGPTSYAQIPELVERGCRRAEFFFDRMNQQLRCSIWLAGDSYSFADISLLVMTDFAKRIKLDALQGRAALTEWYQRAAARESASA